MTVLHLSRLITLFMLLIHILILSRFWRGETSAVEFIANDRVQYVRFTPYNSSEIAILTDVQNRISQGEYIFPRTLSGLSSPNLTKILIYITTHFSPQHEWYLRNCWPQVLRHSTILRNSEIMAYLTPLDWERTEDALNLFNTLFISNKLTVHVRNNQAKQEGAMMALAQAASLRWFDGYDWVVRLNPDVILRDEYFLLNTMLRDPSATALMIKCQSTKLKNTLVNTDFFAIRPDALQRHAFLHPSTGNAELSFTEDMKPVLERGGQRWIRAAFPVDYACRAGSGKFLSDTPISHFHVDTSTLVCPVPMVDSARQAG